MFKHPYYVYGPKDRFVPARLNLGDYMVQKLKENENKIAMTNGATNEHLSYGEILQSAMNLAISLTRMGVRKGDVIGICSETRQEVWGTVVAIACAGAIMTPISIAYVKDELKHVANISKPKYIFCSEQAYKEHEEDFKNMPFLKNVIIFGENISENTLSYNDLVYEDRKNPYGKIKNVNFEEFEVVEVDGQTDMASIMYSSGSTGLPKGVMLTHLNVITACQMEYLDPELKVLIITPWYHTLGMVVGLSALCHGYEFVYLSKYEMHSFLRTIEKYRINQLALVPSLIISLTKAEFNYDISSLKVIICASAPISTETMEAAKNKFKNLRGVYQAYGMTESTGAVTYDFFSNGRACKTGSVGKVVNNTVIKVIDTVTRKPVGPNKKGEIYCKSILCMKGYMGKDRSDFDEEGFFRTGDIGYYDEEKYFYIVDRLKELIKFKGFPVPPAEIEAVLLQHPGVMEVGVVGAPHSVAGEVPVAFVVSQQGVVVTEKELQQFVADRLSNPKHLRGGVRFVSEIPKTSSGKVSRRHLREIVSCADVKQKL